MKHIMLPLYIFWASFLPKLCWAYQSYLPKLTKCLSPTKADQQTALSQPSFSLGREAKNSFSGAKGVAFLASFERWPWVKTSNTPVKIQFKSFKKTTVGWVLSSPTIAFSYIHKACLYQTVPFSELPPRKAKAGSPWRRCRSSSRDPERRRGRSDEPRGTWPLRCLGTPRDGVGSEVVSRRRRSKVFFLKYIFK